MKKLLTASLLTAVFSSSAFAAGFLFAKDSCLTPYAGVDAGMRYSPFQRNFGGNVFKEYYPEGNIFLGVKFSDYLGAELGYKTSVTKTRTVSLGAGETIVGVPIANPPETHRATSNFKAWHVKLIGLIPIYRQDCISLLGSIGMSRTKLFAQDKILQASGPFGAVGLLDGQSDVTFSKTKNILTLGTGIQFAVDEKTYLRAKIDWEGTSGFKSIIAKETAANALKLKDTFVYSIGVVFNFL